MLSLSNAHLRELSKLKQKKYRLETGKVIVEGRRTLGQLATWGIYPTELYALHPDSALRSRQSYLVSEQAMARLCDSENPPEIAGLFTIPEARAIDFHVAFYLEEISDPGNLGTIFRSAAAFGTDCLILSPETCEISSPKVIRASLGAVFRVPFFYAKPEELPGLQAKLICLQMEADREIADLRPSEKSILAIGNEAHGLSNKLLGLCQESVTIPMPGSMESLNAALSFGIAAYEIARCRENSK